MMDTHHGWHTSYKPLFLGVVFSLILLLGIYRIVVHAHLPFWAMETAILLFATVQAIMQIVFFMHIGLEAKPQWSLLLFGFMVFVILLIVLGSIWIMSNVRCNLMPEGY